MTIVTLLTLVFLVAMWVAVLAAPILQNRGSSGGRRGDSVRSFQRQLATLGRANPRQTTTLKPVALGRSRPAPTSLPVGSRRGADGVRLAQQRRRRALGTLVSVAAITLVLAWQVGGVFVPMQFLADALLLGYVGLMVRIVRLAAEREMKVAFLPHRSAGAEPTALLRDAISASR